MSSVATVHKRKDGSGVFVIARHELALQPGLAVWEAFHEPKDGNGSVLRDYLWFHIILGWVLTTLWVGGLTGLVKK